VCLQRTGASRTSPAIRRLYRPLIVSTARIVVMATLGLLAFCGTAFGLTVALRSESDSRSTLGVPVHHMVIQVDTGDVDIRAGLTCDVVVSRHDSWIFNRPTVHQTVDGDTLRIRETCSGLASALRCRSDVRIDAPPEVDVTVRTKSGDVDLRGLSGRVRVETDAGDIRAERIDTVTMHAWTDAGDIDLDLFGNPARTQADSDAGDIKVVVPFNSYRVDANSDSGKVSVRGIIRDDLAPRAIHAMTDAGDVTVRAR